MSKCVSGNKGILAPSITGSINSHYQISEHWKNSSLDRSDEAWQVHSCKKCEECSCEKCRDIHKRVSLSDVAVSEAKCRENLKLVKVNSYNVKVDSDARDCWITGIIATDDDRLIIADCENNTVKMFGRNIQFIFSLYLQFHPWDITLIGKDLAAVSMSGRQLALINISEIHMAIKNTLKLSFDIYGIVAYDGKLIVTSMTALPSVKLIDTTGKVYWSVPLNHKGKQLFKWPMYASVSSHLGRTSVVVTDSGNSTVTLLHAETGEFIKRNWLPWSTEPQCITTDDKNNIFICCIGSNDVMVFSQDLSDYRVVLSRRGIFAQWLYESARQLDLDGKPWALFYHQKTHHLIVSYDNKNSIDFYKSEMYEESANHNEGM